MAFHEARAALITFEEYPLLTHITNQYQDLGVIFSGDPYEPVINIPAPVFGVNEPALYCPAAEPGTNVVTIEFVDPSKPSRSTL
jgi:hypothetical protein